MKKKLFFTAMLVLIAQTSFADLFDIHGHAIPGSNWKTPGINAELVKDTDPPTYKSIGLLAPKSNLLNMCTATFIDTHGSKKSPGYLLTAGHCVRPKNIWPTEIMVDVAWPGIFMLEVKSDADGEGIETTSFNVRKIVYAVNDALDLAILELETGYQEISEIYSPMVLGKQSVEKGKELIVLGYPAQKELLNKPLYLSRCTRGSIRDDIEIRHKCSVDFGSSGGPILSSETQKIIGVVSSKTKDVNFGVSAVSVASCFDAKGIFNLKLPACKLPKPGSSVGCDQGYGHSCDQLAHLYAEQETMESIYKMNFFKEKSCSLNSEFGCANLAASYEGGVGVEQSETKAVELFSKSCSLEDSYSCLLVGASYYDGVGVSKSIQTALDFYKKACDLLDEKGCYAAATVLDEMKLDSGIFFYQKACDLGMKASCGRKAMVNEKSSHEPSNSNDGAGGGRPSGNSSYGSGGYEGGFPN